MHKENEEREPLKRVRQGHEYTLQEADYEDLLINKEAAKLIRKSPHYLHKTRIENCGPPFVHVGRTPLYPRRWLREWMRVQMEKAVAN